MPGKILRIMLNGYFRDNWEGGGGGAFKPIFKSLPLYQFALDFTNILTTYIGAISIAYML